MYSLFILARAATLSDIFGNPEHYFDGLDIRFICSWEPKARMAEKSKVLETIYKLYVQRYGGAQPANTDQNKAYRFGKLFGRSQYNRK
jgi:hypothetical protein